MTADEAFKHISQRQKTISNWLIPQARDGNEMAIACLQELRDLAVEAGRYECLMELAQVISDGRQISMSIVIPVYHEDIGCALDQYMEQQLSMIPEDNIKTVVFDKDKLKRFNEAISQARDKGESEFVFEGDKWLVQFAEYTAEYLKDKV